MIVGAHITSELKTFINANPVENEDENALRYLMEMLINVSHRSALQDQKLSLKIEFNVTHLRDMDHKNGHLKETINIVDNMSNNVYSCASSRIFGKAPNSLLCKSAIVLLTTHFQHQASSVLSSQLESFLQ